MEYDKNQLDELKQNIDLLDYASQEFEFRRVGTDSYATICNKHKDVNPSLYISPSKQRWFCFGCKRGGDIITWLMSYENLSFDAAVHKLESLTGTTITQSEVASSVKIFQALSQLQQVSPPITREILTNDYLDQFEIPPVGEPHEWLNDGISQEMIYRFNIRIDKKSNRIVYPVYDANDNLIGVKGRTRFENYKVLGLAKYINYKKIGTTDYFQGMHENHENIIKKNSIIIVEGIKSVMLLTGWGYDNSVSVETSKINDNQIKALLKLDISDVTLAFDKDVTMEAMLIEGRKLNKFMNTYIIYDKDGLLGSPDEKCSPPDKGRDIWERLYSERVRINV